MSTIFVENFINVLNGKAPQQQKKNYYIIRVFIFVTGHKQKGRYNMKQKFINDALTFFCGFGVMLYALICL